MKPASHESSGGRFILHKRFPESRSRSPKDCVSRGLGQRTRSTLEFLGTWEIMYNPNFKVVEFDHFKSEAGLHTFMEAERIKELLEGGDFPK